MFSPDFPRHPGQYELVDNQRGTNSVSMAYFVKIIIIIKYIITDRLASRKRVEPHNQHLETQDMRPSKTTKAKARFNFCVWENNMIKVDVEYESQAESYGQKNELAGFHKKECKQKKFIERTEDKSKHSETTFILIFLHYCQDGGIL